MWYLYAHLYNFDVNFRLPLLFICVNFCGYNFVLVVVLYAISLYHGTEYVDTISQNVIGWHSTKLNIINLYRTLLLQ